jgi:hypothetical protein
MDLASSEVKEEGRVLIGDTVVGVAQRVRCLEGAWPVGVVEENSSQAETTSRLWVSFSS